MKRIYFLLFLIIITSCNKEVVILKDDSLFIKTNSLNIENNENINEIIKEKINVYTVIPHHNLVNEEIDGHYKKLKDEYEEFDNIVLI
jgi:hypothetical protein